MLGPLFHPMVESEAVMKQKEGRVRESARGSVFHIDPFYICNKQTTSNSFEILNG